jgi:2EXR family
MQHRKTVPLIRKGRQQFRTAHLSLKKQRTWQWPPKSEAPPTPVIQIDPEGDFFRFPNLPANVRQRIWKYAIPSGRVVDVVFEQEKDRYFSFAAIVPPILHVTKESRAVGLRFYTLCFGTESHLASIPFDFSVDCLFLDDWLAPRTVSATGAPPPYASELARVNGPVGAIEMRGIHRVAIPIDYFTCFTYKKFVDGLQVLFSKFPATDYLVLAIERPDPYASGQVYFKEIDANRWCCGQCYFCIRSKVPAAIEAALPEHNKGTEEEESTARTKLRFRIAFRGYERYRLHKDD